MKINFSPGPSQLYFTVPDHIRSALRENMGSLSHRSTKFKSLYQEVVEGLQALMQIPPTHSVYLLSSASEIFERSLTSLVDTSSFHFVNGAFAEKYFETSIALGKRASRIDAAYGKEFNSLEITANTELICITHNETSTGTSFPLQSIYGLKAENPDVLISVDAVSSAPIPSFDFTQIDSLFFSVQKGFGLPAGLGVWIVNEQCVERANRLLIEKKIHNTFHNIPNLEKYYKSFQTPETPNVLSIYLLAKVIQDMQRRGIEMIRKETAYKSALLYHTLAGSSVLTPFVKKREWQSSTVIVAETAEPKKS
ncbi:MAG: alanine--glyoxylate aminotransferase family protein [Flammeovirgaceae bacterium]|nr:alanine--glyoxylate aminotransferase family protein [Flammeovirgaceae bacterium]